MRQMQPLVDTKVVRPAESALALRLVTEMELLRLKTIAKLHARGLPPDVGWDDLLQEALTRVLTGYPGQSMIRRKRMRRTLLREGLTCERM